VGGVSQGPILLRGLAAVGDLACLRAVRIVDVAEGVPWA
jgi:hypothetical protein